MDSRLGPLRAQVSAAPLKHPGEERQDLRDNPPRSSERGPVEARLRRAAKHALAEPSALK